MKVSTVVKAATSATVVTAVTGATLLQKWVEKRKQQQGGTDERARVSKDWTTESTSVPQGDAKVPAKNTEHANGPVHAKSFAAAGFTHITSLANTSIFNAKSLAGDIGDKQSKSKATPDPYCGKINATRVSYLGQGNATPVSYNVQSIATPDPYFGKCNATTSPNHDKINATSVTYHGKNNTAPDQNGKRNASPGSYYGKNNTAAGLYHGNATASPNHGNSNATTGPYHGNSNAATGPYHVESNALSGQFIHKYMTSNTLVKRLVSDGISAAHSLSLITSIASLSVNPRSAQGDGPGVPLWTEGRDFYNFYLFPKYIPGPDSTLYGINSDILDYDSDCDVSSDIFDMDDDHFSFFGDTEITDTDTSDDSSCDSLDDTDSMTDPLDTADSYSPWDDITFSEYYDTSDISTFDFAAPRASDAPSL